MSALSATATKRAGQRRSAIGTESRHGVILREEFETGCNCTAVGESVKEGADWLNPLAGLTMHFGPLVPSNIYPVGLSQELVQAKV